MGTNGAYSIFLVDDDKLFLRSLEHHLLQKLKFNVKVRSFPTGEDCLKEMNVQKPNIVVLDYLLDTNRTFAMDGISVLQKIKQSDPDTRVIMLSGQEKMDVAVDTLKHGAYDYLVKNGNTLYKTQNAIRNAISDISLTRENRIYKRLIKFIFFLIATFFVASVTVYLIS